MARDRSFDNEEFSPQTGDTLRQDGRIFNIADAELEARSPFGRSGVYELTNQLSLAEFRAFRLQNDHEATASGSADKTVANGRLTISTGATSGSVYRYETAMFGTYQSGKGVQGGIGFSLDQALTGDSAFRVGAATADDGAFFRFTAGDIEAVWRAGGTEQKAVSQSDWNVDTLDGSNDDNNPSGLNFDPVTMGAKAEIRYTWYSFGPISWALVFPDPNAPHEMRVKEVHREKPSGVAHFENPDLPVFAEIDNGTTTTDFSATIGGRTFGVFGEFEPDSKEHASVLRQDQAVAAADGLVPLVAIDRKAEYPTGITNTITAFVNDFDVRTDQVLRVAFYSVPGRSDLTNSAFGGFDNVSAERTALQGDESATDIANAERISRKFVVDGTANNKPQVTRDKGLRIPIIRQRPTVLAANALGTDATVTSEMSAVEFG